MVKAEKTNPKKRKDTGQAIVALVRELIQTKGYNGISYLDIAKTMGMTKASVHYHFPSKSDLGAAVIRDYHEAHRCAIEPLIANPNLNALEKMTAYLEPFLQVADSGELVCLCGVLAGEFITLPPEMQAEVTQFFGSHLSWLAQLLALGEKEGIFTLSHPPQVMANWMLGSLQGTLLLVRAQHNPALFNDLVAVMYQNLGVAI